MPFDMPAWQIWRDFETVFDSTTGPHRPQKSAIRGWGTVIEHRVNSEFVDVAEFGAVGDGVANDRDAILFAAESLGARGGTVRIPRAMRCAINTSATLPPNVHVRGPHRHVGSPGTNATAPYGNIGGALLIDPAATLTLSSGSTLSGLLVHRRGMVFPTANSDDFAGTAIVAGGDDTGVYDCMILGFLQAFRSVSVQRPRLHNNAWDNHNNILIQQCFDIGYISHNHAWPYSGIAFGPKTTNWALRGINIRFENVGDWNKASDNFSYGYTRGFQAGDCNSFTFLNCSADGVPGYDTIGFEIVGGCTDARIIGGQAAAQRIGIRLANNLIPGLLTKIQGCDTWASGEAGIRVDGGDALILGNAIRTTPVGILVTSSSSFVGIDDTRFSDIVGRPIAYTGPGTSSRIRIGAGNVMTDASAGGSLLGNGVADTLVGLPRLTAADPLHIPPVGSHFWIDGNTSFGTISGMHPGRVVHLVFSGTPSVFDGTSMRLAGNFAANANWTLSLLGIEGGVAVEIARSAN